MNNRLYSITCFAKWVESSDAMMWLTVVTESFYESMKLGTVIDGLWISLKCDSSVTFSPWNNCNHVDDPNVWKHISFVMRRQSLLSGETSLSATTTSNALISHSLFCFYSLSTWHPTHTIAQVLEKHCRIRIIYSMHSVHVRPVEWLLLL